MTWEIEMSTGWTNDWMLTIADWFCTQRTGDDVGGGGTGVELLKFKGLWLGYLSCGVRQKGEVMWVWGGGGG